jgi:hypothetical protein
VNYTLIFEASQAGYRPGPGIAIALLLLGVAYWMFGHRDELAERNPRFFLIFFFGFVIFLALVVLVSTIRDYTVLPSALREGRCEVIEGVVTDFDPLPRNGKGRESFVVNGKRFEYSDSEPIAGFHQTSVQGGPIYIGLKVRIHCLGGQIARLEIAR